MCRHRILSVRNEGVGAFYKTYLWEIFATRYKKLCSIKGKIQCYWTVCGKSCARTFFTSAWLSTQAPRQQVRIDPLLVVGPRSELINLILCPGTTFDTSTNILMPTLNNVNIVCGNGGPNMMCIFDGGNKNENVQIQNPSIQGYVLNSVNIEGVTFQNFNGRSVDLGASAPTTATFKDCTWQVKVSILLISSN